MRPRYPADDEAIPVAYGTGTDTAVAIACHRHSGTPARECCFARKPAAPGRARRRCRVRLEGAVQTCSHAWRLGTEARFGA